MPKNLRNWTFQEASGFLEQNYFVLRNVEGSHYYYVGLVDGKDRICQVARHGDNGTLPPKTLKINIIEKSGIPIELWEKFCVVPSNQRKRIVYEGAKPREFASDVVPVLKTFTQISGDVVDSKLLWPDAE